MYFLQIKSATLSQNATVLAISVQVCAKFNAITAKDTILRLVSALSVSTSQANVIQPL